MTPAYNEERHIAECIESVLSQTYSHWEHVIVDNCSTDGPLQIARRYAARDPPDKYRLVDECGCVIGVQFSYFETFSPMLKLSAIRSWQKASERELSLSATRIRASLIDCAET